MSIKVKKLIGVFLIFGLSFLLHSLYNFIPNVVLSIFVPVNESIWEHMKIIYTGFLLYGIVEYFWIKEKNNFLFQLAVVPIIGIILYLSIYIPIRNIIGESMIFSILLLFFIITIEQLLSYYFLIKDKIKYQYVFSVVIILMYILFGYLTYKPIENYIFFDNNHEKYGIDQYIK